VDKNEIFHNSLARSKIVLVIQAKYRHWLQQGMMIWSTHVFGYAHLEKMAMKYSASRRNQPLPLSFDRWIAFSKTRRHLTRLLFKIFLRWHVHILDAAFGKWSKVNEMSHLRRLQLTRVYGKIGNRQLSRAFNKFYYVCQDEIHKELVVVEKMFLNWINFLGRRHRVRWLLLKLVGRNVNDLFRESLKMWHLIAHKMADQERFEQELNKSHTHIAHLKARSGGLASKCVGRVSEASEP